jgi:hypothetical protein
MRRAAGIPCSSAIWLINDARFPSDTFLLLPEPIRGVRTFRGKAGCISKFGLTLKYLAWPGRGVPVIRNHEEDVLDLSCLKYVLTIRHVG